MQCMYKFHAYITQSNFQGKAFPRNFQGLPGSMTWVCSLCRVHELVLCCILNTWLELMCTEHQFHCLSVLLTWTWSAHSWLRNVNVVCSPTIAAASTHRSSRTCIWWSCEHSALGILIANVLVPIGCGNHCKSSTHVVSQLSSHALV